MASLAGDDQTDADFFDKLVDDDDDLAAGAAAAAAGEEAMASQLSSLSLGDEELDATKAVAASVADEKAVEPAAPAEEEAADVSSSAADAAAAPEGGSPGSSKGSSKGGHTTIKQVQWSVFGGTEGPGADPFGDLMMQEKSAEFGGGDEGFCGNVAGNQSMQTSTVGSAGPADHEFLGGMAGNESSGGGGVAHQEYYGNTALDQNLNQSSFGISSDLNQNTNVQWEQTNSSVVSDQAATMDTTDPKYLEHLYPGWKYDEGTQQWYQVDSFGMASNAQLDSSSNAANVVGSHENYQQQFSVSYLQNSAQAVLETIAEESAVGSISNWGQDNMQGATVEYPPNMLFYAEYPGWYFDTNTQQWNSLESYQQAIAQMVPNTLQDGASHGLNAASDAFAGTGQSVGQTENHAAHNQGTQQFGGSQNSFANSYTQQSQWQPDAYGNNVHSEGFADNSLAGSFYGSEQHTASHFSQQTSQQIGFSTFKPSASHPSGTTGLESSTSAQASYKAFGTDHAGYKAFEPSTVHQVGYKGFEPSTAHQSGYKGFEPSTGHQTGYKGFESSASHQTSYKGFEPSTGHQTGYKGFEPSTGHQTGYKGFEPSAGHQIGHKGFEPSTSHSYGNANGVVNLQGFGPSESMYHSQTLADASPQVHLSNSYLGSENSMNFSQQQFLSGNVSHSQFGYTPQEERSSAGRPPHALVAFGFGGKLIVMKETSSMATNFNSGDQVNASGTLSVLNLPEIVADKIDASSIVNGSALSYFHALCRQPIPGPLVGGSAATKDVNKWLDEMAASYESSTNEFQRGDLHKMLIALLKILCQHYGKLRSPFGSDPSQEDVDGPEMSVTKLFSSSKRSGVRMREYGSIVRCMKNLPSESQLQATAQEVQNLLVSGRRKEALHFAQEGQLWGPALILALQLGDKFYVDTVKKMAHCHFISGSPLRTLCLLIAGQPADVFNVENPVNSSYSTLSSQQPTESTPGGMLDDWEENLAIITANRTKGDELVITHLGDCLWKEKNEVAAAHSCYLVAELNIDSYSESARMCLIGADHLKCPRTFAYPEAIQRTEVYEYAKVLGNSQYILLPFQPYKLIYAYMLAEVGKVSDSLRYCQASLKLLKSSGRAPELEVWKQLFSSLEERIRTHQQGGYGTNLAPAKLVGKIFTSLDKSISRMMGTQSAPLPPLPQGPVNDRDSYPMPASTKVVNSQSVMAMSSLMPSASVESISAMSGNSGAVRKIAHNRSVSEPDFGRTPKQGAGPDSAQSSASGSGNSRFGWFSSTLQKTMGLVSKSHRQAKLGETNKFYYDEKLKRWVEEGADVPAEEPPLPPPPTKAPFQNGMPDYNLNGPQNGTHMPNGFPETKPSMPSEPSSGMPPIPPSQNQFSARGRMGVRSRYVDTFNKSGGIGAVAPSYNSPAAPSMKPPAGAKFFVPTAAAIAVEQKAEQAIEARNETTLQDEPSSSPTMEASYSSPPPQPPLSSGLQRHPSMDNITPHRGSLMSSGSVNSSFSRSRAASWSGTYSDIYSSTVGARSPDGQTIPSPLIPGNASHSRSNSNSSVQFNGMSDDLHEVEL